MQDETDQRMHNAEPVEGVEGGVLLHYTPSGAFQTYGESPLERLLSSIESHAAQEQASLGDYSRLAERAGDPGVTLLMKIVIEDEERHHRLLERMSASLRDSLQWTHSPDALQTEVPPGAPPPDRATMAEAIEVTRAFIQEERQGAQFLRKLAKKERQIHGGLFSVLLETMAMDSEKHEHVMRFILDRLMDRGAER